MNTNTLACIFGEVLFDQFPDRQRVLGGAPFNVAWHLQAFGAAPLLVSRVGRDANGQQVRASMRTWGMRDDGLQEDGEHATGEVIVSLEDGEPSYDIVAPRAFDFIAPELPGNTTPTLLYHGSLALREPGAEQRLATLRATCNAPVFLDVNLRPPWWNLAQLERLLATANWVKLNRDELDTLMPGPGTPEQRAQALCQRFDLQMAIVTLGANGAFVTGPGLAPVRAIPPPALTVVDTVGAGDAFAAVMLLGLLHAWPPALSLERAQAFAARLVGCRGATQSDTNFYTPLRQAWGL